MSRHGIDANDANFVDLTDLSVLIADDNQDAADSLSLMLEQSGASVCVAYGGISALQSFDLIKPDVAIIDLGMLDIDGLEVARRIRDQDGSKGTILIALTGWTGEKFIRATSAVGFDRHLIKPVDFDVLLEHLRRLL